MRFWAVLLVIQLSVYCLLAVYEVVEANLSPAVVLRGDLAALVLVLDHVVSGLLYRHLFVAGEFLSLGPKLLHVVTEQLSARKVVSTFHSRVYFPHREVALGALVVNALVRCVFHVHDVPDLMGISCRSLLLAQGDDSLGCLAQR